MGNLLIVKIGGNVIDDERLFQSFIHSFASIPGAKILVHGGGKAATELSTKLGIETKQVNGRRITDEATLNVVTMTYAGLINKKIVAALQSETVNAVGLTGIDGAAFKGVKRPVKEIDYGYVADLISENVNTSFLKLLLDNNIVPIIAPITANEYGQLLNVNADTVASTLAESLAPYYNTQLVFCFEMRGVLRNINDPDSIISEINFPIAEKLKQEGVITKGMAPKVENALEAISKGVEKVVIGSAIELEHLALNKKGYGTIISN